MKIFNGTPLAVILEGEFRPSENTPLRRMKQQWLLHPNNGVLSDY